MASESRDLIEAAYQEHVRRREAGDWAGLAELFAEDARYFDPIFGWQRGRGAIRDFLQEAMAGLAERIFSDQWHIAQDDRLVLYWQCTTPGAEGPESVDDVYHGMSALRLSGGGLWTEQMDIYDREQAKSSRRGARLD